MLQPDVDVRKAKYNDIASSISLQGYFPKVWQEINYPDGIRLSISSQFHRDECILLAKRDTGWILITPKFRNLFQIANESDVEDICVNVLGLLKSSADLSVYLDSMKNNGDMREISRSEWHLMERRIRLEQYRKCGWTCMSDSEDLLEWNRYEEQFGFPEIGTSPKPSMTWDIGWSFHLDPQAYLELEIDFTRTVLTALRSCVPTGEELTAFIWNTTSYFFNPHADIPGFFHEYWAAPLVPDLNDTFMMAKDFSFGIHSLVSEKSICIFGKQLLQAVLHDKPLLLRDVIRNDHSE